MQIALEEARGGVDTTEQSASRHLLQMYEYAATSMFEEVGTACSEQLCSVL